MKRAAEPWTENLTRHTEYGSLKVLRQSEPITESNQGSGCIEATDAESLKSNEWSKERQHESSDDDDDDEDAEQVELSKTLIMYPQKILAKRRNVVCGEICCTITNQNRPCVIKFDQNPEQIMREANALCKLSTHCDVVCLIDSGTCKNTVIDVTYLVLEKCHELNLEQYLRNKNILPVYDINQGLKFCRQMICGVKYIHENLIIHKDLKLSNILLTHDLENIKIADFGSSQEIKSLSSMISCLNTFGTLGYRPPESLNHTFVSLKSDSYSLGVVFYTLLSMGKSPFGSQSDLWDHNTKNGIIDLSDLIPNPMAAQHLIKSMLHLERCCRPSTEMIEQHPFWNEEQCAVDFCYNFEEEIEDSDITGDASSDTESEDSEDELLAALESIPMIDRILSSGRKGGINQSADTHIQSAITKILQDCHEGLEVTEASKLSMALIAGAEKLRKNQPDEAMNLAIQSIPKSLSPDDVNQVGIDLEEKHPLCAIIMHRTAAVMYSPIPDDVTPEEAVSWISNRISNISCVAEQIMESNPSNELKNVALVICPNLMQEVLQDLRMVENAKGKSKTLCEVSYYVCVTRIYLDATRKHGVPPNPNTITMCKEGLECLEKQFGKNARKYRYRGYLINNIGEAYLQLGQLDDAEPYLKQAMSIKKASTYRTREARLIDVSMTQRNLDELQKLRKMQNNG